MSSCTCGTQQTWLIFHVFAGCPLLTALGAAHLAIRLQTHPKYGAPRDDLPHPSLCARGHLRAGFTGQAFYNTATPCFCFRLKSYYRRHTPWGACR